MPSSSAVRDQLTDILVRVLGCPAAAVMPEADLKDLGTDSLTIVEIGEELGRRFDVYLSDNTIDELRTVQDAIDAVVHHDGSTPTNGWSRVPANLASPSSGPSSPASSPMRTSTSTPAKGHTPVDKRRGLASRVGILLGLVGAALGLVLGLGGAALVGATGLGAVDLPPITIPTSEATTTPTPKPTPTPAPTTGDVEPEPTLDAASDRVAPGQRFGLSGTFPALDEGQKLQVQVKDDGSGWDDFPITTTTRSDGTFKTEIYTSRTGERQFRMLHEESGDSTPAVTVQIG